MIILKVVSSFVEMWLILLVLVLSVNTWPSGDSSGSQESKHVVMSGETTETNTWEGLCTIPPYRITISARQPSNAVDFVEEPEQ